jgi:iron complex transport system ATP-binding protein
MIELRQICFGYSGKGILRGVDATFRSGAFTALLGPNGAGKSTMLRIAGGELRPGLGEVLFDGAPTVTLAPRELARRRAFLPQDSQLDFPFTVEEVVLLGRAPHMARGETRADLDIVHEALRLAGMDGFASRDYTTLSGGERQRVQLARVLAQAWGRAGTTLLLDEPVASLDPAHQHETLSIARDWARAGACVVAVLHDVNLALRYADDALLLNDGHIAAAGPARSVLTAETVSRVFGVAARAYAAAPGEPPFIVVSGVV